MANQVIMRRCAAAIGQFHAVFFNRILLIAAVMDDALHPAEDDPKQPYAMRRESDIIARVGATNSPLGNPKNLRFRDKNHA